MKRRGVLTAAFAALLSLIASGALAVGLITQAGARYTPPSAPPSQTITTLQLTSTSGGSNLPFMVAQGFAKGDVPTGSAIVSDTAGVTLRGVCLARWRDDDSCLHAALVGTSTLSAGVAKTITLKTGTAAGGTALTCADIATDAPSASVAITGVGTVNLSSLLASPFRTYLSTPELVECHYRSAVAGDTDLAAWFYVRMWADGTNFIRAAVENGYLNGAPTTETHTVTVTIGGATPINGTSIAHLPWTRYDATGWISTDPAITLTLDRTYLIDSLLVPNFATYAMDQAPSSTVLDGLDGSYTPMDTGLFPPAIGAGGASDWIGPMPQEDSLCVTSGDSRACVAAEQGSRALGAFSLYRRSSSTNVQPRPSDFSTTTYNSGNGCGGSNGDINNGTTNWDVAHAPLEGYLPYLRTADFYHLETLGFAAQAYYFCRGNTGGNGVNRNWRGYQARSIGWGFNIAGSWLAIYPTEVLSGADLAVRSDYQTLIGNVVANFASTVNSNGIGLPYMFSTGGWDYETGGTNGSIPPWTQHFKIYGTSRLLELQALASDTNLNTLLADLYKFPVGLLGPTGAGNFYFAHAGRYGLFVDPTGVGVDFDPNVTDFLDSFYDVFTGTMGFTNDGLSTNTLQGTSGANPALSDSYWMNLNIGIVPAVDHGATGAATAYGRLTGATNWPPAGSGTNTCDNKPNFCLEPR